MMTAVYDLEVPVVHLLVGELERASELTRIAIRAAQLELRAAGECPRVSAIADHVERAERLRVPIVGPCVTSLPARLGIREGPGDRKTGLVERRMQRGERHVSVLGEPRMQQGFRTQHR